MFDKRASAEEVSSGIDLSGRHAIVTGANTGIGLETARVLALRGASVTMACRNRSKAEASRQRLLAQAEGRIEEAQLELADLDLSRFDSVRSFADEFLRSGRPLHLLINNAGVMLPAKPRTASGFDAHFCINHLGHFLLTNLLGEALERSAPARVVCVSSDALAAASLSPALTDLNWDERRYSGIRSYGDSKLMNVMFATEWTRRMGGRGVVANALHPGIVDTELGRDQGLLLRFLGLFMWPMMKDPARGASTTLVLATAPEYGKHGGRYLADNAEKAVPKLANDPESCGRLWDISAELTELGAASV